MVAYFRPLFGAAVRALPGRRRPRFGPRPGAGARPDVPRPAAGCATIEPWGCPEPHRPETWKVRMPVSDAQARGRRSLRPRTLRLPRLAILAVLTAPAVAAGMAALLLGGMAPPAQVPDAAAATPPGRLPAGRADADHRPAPPVPARPPQPEATDDAGPTATKRPLTVVALGDSIPAAGACDCTSYAWLAAQQLAVRRQRRPEVQNLALGGLKTSGLRAQLDRPDVQDSLATADIVLITVGANDFDPAPLTTTACRPSPVPQCYQETLATQRGWLADVLTRVNTLTTQQQATVLVTGYWNVFLDGAVGRARGQAYVDASNALTIAENAQIAAVTAAHGDRYVDVYTPFKGTGDTDDTLLLASDGDHPNASGHVAIARAVEDALP